MIELDNIYNMDCLEGMHQLPEGHKYAIVTDPPFNIGYHYNEYTDKMDEDEYYQWLDDITMRYPVALIHYPEALYRFAFQKGLIPERVLSWVYNSNTARQHRDIAFFGMKPNLDAFRQPYKNPNDKRIKERIANGCTGAASYDWFEVDQVKNVEKERLGITHPCVMPLSVMQRIVAFVPEEYVIVEPFSGSGTTAVACIKEHRHFIGFELNKEYYDKSLQRIKTEQMQPTLF